MSEHSKEEAQAATTQPLGGGIYLRRAGSSQRGFILLFSSASECQILSFLPMSPNPMPKEGAVVPFPSRFGKDMGSLEGGHPRLIRSGKTEESHPPLPSPSPHHRKGPGSTWVFCSPQSSSSSC